MTSTTKHTFCRICAGKCGLLVEVDDATDQILRIRGDHGHPMTLGYACVKGLQAGELHQGPQRLLRPLEKQPDGSFAEIDAETALDRIAERIGAIAETHGADAVATFRGTQHYANTTAFHMMSSFIRALGTKSRFSTMTIDQSAKWVADHRLGAWGAGRQRFEDADVWMFIGYNPVVSVQAINGFTALNPVKRLKAAKERGMKIIVIDPRKTETTHYADVHLQIFPGEDPTVMAGLLHLVLANGWHDGEFCDRYVTGLDQLRQAVAHFTPDYVSRRAGIAADDLRRAAELFAHNGRRGIATSGTGPDMIPRSNLAEHLVETLNVVCGRFIREGERLANPGPLSPRRAIRAEVIAPSRPWERGRKSRVHNLGMINGEMMSGVIAEEILTPGEGQVRAMIVDGGNPVNALPDRQQAIRALSSLDLLVTIDPYLSETAELADYVLPPLMMFERPDVPMMFEKTAFPEPYTQYTEAVVKPPSDSDLVEDWYVFWALAKRLGRPLNFAGSDLDMAQPPTTEELLELLLRDAQVDLEELKTLPQGRVFDLPPLYVSGPREDRAGNRFEVAPEDVVAELQEVAGEAVNQLALRNGREYPLRLSVRRDRTVLNTSYRQMSFARKRMPTNPLWLNPQDLDSLGLADGDSAWLVSSHGRLQVALAADKSMKPGVVAISHGWGGSGGGERGEELGVSVNDIIPLDGFLEPINGMPWYSAVPVAIEAVQGASD